VRWTAPTPRRWPGSCSRPWGLVDSTRTTDADARGEDGAVCGAVGARAASAGFLITIAADIAAMAPGTHIGAAHPVSGQGEKMDETMSKKAASDVAAYARTLATGRGRNVEWAEQAVNESRAFTETEALNATPPLIDLVASDVPDLLEAARRLGSSGSTGARRPSGPRGPGLNLSP
jgi:membrane-bound serine protease (ClpP class)